MAARYPETNPSRDGTKTPEICCSCLRGCCNLESHTNCVHGSTAFQWQICQQDGPDWMDLTRQSNKAIEECYCDVNEEYYQGEILDCESGCVAFCTEPMYAVLNSGVHIARRLSTPSSVLKTNWEQSFGIEWIWYWFDESNNWIAYTEKNMKDKKVGVSSAMIELMYLDFESKQGASKISFTAGGQSYELDFTTMQQRNVQSGTCRDVRRRPKFVSMEERMRISQEMFRSQRGEARIPTTRNNPCIRPHKKQLPVTDCSSEEYATIANFFWDTMDDQANIVSIQRVENLALLADLPSNVVHDAHQLFTPPIILTTDREQVFCIEWMWHWCDEKNNWTAYSKENMKDKKDGIQSATIEQKYLDFESKQGTPTIGFTAGGQSYEIEFTTMQQRNVQSGICRAVRRRPKFASMEERMTLLENTLTSTGNGAVIPTTRDNPCARPDEKQLPLGDCSSEDYVTIANLFWDSMDDQANIVSIQRVENTDLWEDFSRLRERMRKKNTGQPVLQKRLFHGTLKEQCDAICRQNFDWRLSGTNAGTILGKGSYFARDASFAHNYAKPDSDGCHYVFVVQVLVGDYTKGDKSFLRPPSKDGTPHGELYDSCVDNIHNPTKFVIFEKDQIYPEYLIKYNLKR